MAELYQSKLIKIAISMPDIKMVPRVLVCKKKCLNFKEQTEGPIDRGFKGALLFTLLKRTLLIQFKIVMLTCLKLVPSAKNRGFCASTTIKSK